VFPFSSLHPNAGSRLRQEILLLPETLQNPSVSSHEGEKRCTELTPNDSVIPGILVSSQMQQPAEENSVQFDAETRPNSPEQQPCSHGTRSEADTPATSDSRRSAPGSTRALGAQHRHDAQQSGTATSRGTTRGTTTATRQSPVARQTRSAASQEPAASNASSDAGEDTWRGPTGSATPESSRGQDPDADSPAQSSARSSAAAGSGGSGSSTSASTADQPAPPAPPPVYRTRSRTGNSKPKVYSNGTIRYGLSCLTSEPENLQVALKKKLEKCYG
jgi:hypothetical protein